MSYLQFLRRSSEDGLAHMRAPGVQTLNPDARKVKSWEKVGLYNRYLWGFDLLLESRSPSASGCWNRTELDLKWTSVSVICAHVKHSVCDGLAQFKSHISGCQPEGGGFNIRPGRGLNFIRPSFATPPLDRNNKPLALSLDLYRRLKKTRSLLKRRRAIVAFGLPNRCPTKQGSIPIIIIIIIWNGFPIQTCRTELNWCILLFMALTLFSKWFSKEPIDNLTWELTFGKYFKTSLKILSLIC